MTIADYLSNALQPFGVVANELTDIYLGHDFLPTDEYDSTNASEVGMALTNALPILILRPRMSNVSENGFSVSWDYDSLTKYYLYLCRKYGITPDQTVLETAGVSVITDKTNIW